MGLRSLIVAIALQEPMTDGPEFIPTRQTLLSRLKDRDDQESWRTFFDTYWRLIYNTALKAGLNDAEAQDTVQETILCVFKSMPGFEYDPHRGSFKGWLLRLTQWRIVDQLRKRQPGIDQNVTDSDTGMEAIQSLPDLASQEMEAVWNEEWEKNLLGVAIDRVKRKVDPKQYQIFDLYAMKGWTVSKVAQTMNVNPALVYLVKHRVGSLIKKEAAYLRTQSL